MNAKADYFDVARDAASVRMFANSTDWPHIVLPVKNYELKKKADPFPLLGVIANPASEKLPLIIYETDIFSLDFKNSKQHVYASVEAAMDAGWVVD